MRLIFDTPHLPMVRQWYLHKWNGFSVWRGALIFQFNGGDDWASLLQYILDESRNCFELDKVLEVQLYRRSNNHGLAPYHPRRDPVELGSRSSVQSPGPWQEWNVLTDVYVNDISEQEGLPDRLWWPQTNVFLRCLRSKYSLGYRYFGMLDNIHFMHARILRWFKTH